MTTHAMQVWYSDTLAQGVETAVTALRAGDPALPLRIAVPSHLMGGSEDREGRQAE